MVRLKVGRGFGREELGVQEHAGVLPRAIVKERAPTFARLRRAVIPFVPIRCMVSTLQRAVGQAHLGQQARGGVRVDRLTVVA